ncbi:MAG TPA: sigma-70 family RNA polymerase sigma factor [Thermoanaerobaculia bacterium]|nr:sigma-70 family RNA polymerase sigma factor [Thermoanaerobaculia bacterium]
MEAETDGVLIQRAREGDDSAFALLVDRYKDSLINYLRHLTRSHDRAEEIAQDAFVRLYRSGTKYDRLAPALFRIATNLAISHARREKRWKLLLPVFRASHPTHEPARDTLLVSEIQTKVVAALQRLPLKFRAPLVLYEIEEWPYQEIANALGCRIGTVKSRISRARALLRADLESWWVGGNHDRETNWRCDAAAAASDSVASIHV